MASDQSFVDYVCVQAGNAGRISFKKMFGEYAIYFENKIVALVCDNRLLLKPTKAGRALLKSPAEAAPYPGAKPCLLLGDEIKDKKLMTKLFRATETELPEPKNKTARKSAGLFIAALLLAPSSWATAATSTITVSPFAAKAANVNAYVLSDAKGTLIVDATRKASDAKELAAFARSKSVPVKMILITHGHPDHFVGLEVLKKEFPHAKIFVANKQIKDDIISMASMKWMSNEPSAQPKSEEHPNGFDYQNEIAILDSDVLKMPGGESLEVLSKFPATEAAHETVLFSKGLNALFASDLAYNKVHLWLAGGVNPESIKNWQDELAHLKQLYGPFHAVVYPGHGEPTDATVFDADAKYMDDLLVTVKSAGTEAEAKKEMMKKYPDWENADFILVQSIKAQTALIQKN